MDGDKVYLYLFIFSISISWCDPAFGLQDIITVTPSQDLDIFHPLSKLDSTLLYDEEKRELHLDDYARPILLNNAVYIQGSNAVIWKYLISKRTWSMPINPPPNLKAYTLTEYQSDLLLIGRSYQSEAPIIVNKFDEDRGWLPVEDIDMSSITSVLTSAPNAEAVLSAVSEGRRIIISWIAYYGRVDSGIDDCRFKLMIIDDLNKCKEVEGPRSADKQLRCDSWSNVMVHDGMLYLSDYEHSYIYTIPLKLLGDGRVEWDTLPDLPHKNFLSTAGAPNLTILNSNVIAAIVPSHDSRAYSSHIVALEPHTKSWIELGEISCDVSIRPAPIKIVGLPPASARNAILFVMGHIHDREEEFGQFSNKTTFSYFAVLEVSATGMYTRRAMGHNKINKEITILMPRPSLFHT